MIRTAVILPFYNESECLEKTLDSVLEFSKQNQVSYSFIFVNDGSTDESLKIVQNKIENLPTSLIQLISYYPCQGKGYAVKQGVAATDADYICFMDSDLAYSLEHIEWLLEKLEKFDMVIGCRNLDSNNLKYVSFFRQVFGKIFNFISRTILSLEFTDMQAGLKGFRKEAAKKLFKTQKSTGFSFDVELIYLAKKYNYSIGEISAIVSIHHRYKVSKVKPFKDSIRMFIELLKILYNDYRGRYE